MTDKMTKAYKEGKTIPERAMYTSDVAFCEAVEWRKQVVKKWKRLESKRE